MTKVRITAALLLAGGLVALTPRPLLAGMCENIDDACQICCDGTYPDDPGGLDHCIGDCMVGYLECVLEFPDME
jgi:hypothetical protein